MVTASMVCIWPTLNSDTDLHPLPPFSLPPKSAAVVSGNLRW